MIHYSATYSPDDNKLRLYASSRLDKETYDRVKAAGFKYAKVQDLFVAPMWTPQREDLLIELAGQIDDEDTSLVERAEQRAERFEDYSDKRANEAESARRAVSAIADSIPLGQPILVGHHSEKRARKDAERIENGMRKAIKLWDTSSYWKDRAAGALRHAKYKESPAVRHRRIKGIEADKRKAERSKLEIEQALRAWIAIEQIADPAIQLEQALKISGSSLGYTNPSLPRKQGDREDFTGRASAYCVLSNSYPNLYAPRTVQEITERVKKVYPNTIAHYDRWIAHYENRLAYENAMLNEQLGITNGGGLSARFDLKPGGKVLVRDSWEIVIRVNKSNGVVNSVTTQKWKYGIEKVKDYEPPTEELAAKVKKATALPPLCNYPSEGFLEMTEAEWKDRKKWSDFPYIGVVKETETVGKHRIRQMPMPGGYFKKQQVFITDAKRVDPPKTESTESAALPKPEPRMIAAQRSYEAPERTAFDDMKDALKQGVKVVSAPQLFPTPKEVADQVVELASIQKFDRVLEPSAGTGALIDAIHSTDIECGITAVEINHELARVLESKAAVTCADFLDMSPVEFGAVDKVVMNPPFENGSDIKHVEHALKFLRDGGRLVSIVANGPRQQAKLKPRATKWVDLPPGSFAGTDVNTAIVVIDMRNG
jgi:hypothetical protein